MIMNAGNDRYFREYKYSKLSLEGQATKAWIPVFAGMAII
jgi:hypothetical protein